MRRAPLDSRCAAVPLVLLLLATSAPRVLARDPGGDETQRMSAARRVLARAPLIDGHNDLAEQLRDRVGNHLDSLDLGSDTGTLTPPMQTDLPRMKRGGMGGAFFAAYVPGTLHGPPATAMMLEQIDVIRRVAERYPRDLALATSVADIERARRDGRIAVLIGVEGGHAIADSLALLRRAYDLGARYLTLTHLKSNDWADAAIWPGAGEDTLRHGGLSPFGREVIREMNRLGMLVDLSHTALATMRAALETSAAPVIFSHSGARAVCDHGRNVPDEILRALTKNGGIVMVDFVPGFTTDEYRDWEGPAWAEWRRLDQAHPNDRTTVVAGFAAWKAQHPAPRVTVAQVADHIDHVRKIAGIDHVGIGTDFEGSESFPEGLGDTSCYPVLFAELVRRGYSSGDLAKISRGNILRVMRQAEQVARRLQKERGPSNATIEELDGNTARP